MTLIVAEEDNRREAAAMEDTDLPGRKEAERRVHKNGNGIVENE